MSAANPVNIARVPGRLVLSPTDLSAAFPHGGTKLGTTRDNEFRPRAVYHEEEAEEWATTSRVFYCGTKAGFACVLRDWDNDALGIIFPETSTGSVTGDKVVSQDVNDNTLRAGRALTGYVILWSPLAPISRPALLLYNAVPMLDESIRLQLSIKAEMSPALIFRCLPDSAGRTYAHANIGDLSL